MLSKEKIGALIVMELGTNLSDYIASGVNIKKTAIYYNQSSVDKLNNNINKFLAVNIGSDQWNYQIAELAEAVANKISGTTVNINKDAPPDKRSYRVDFSLFKPNITAIGFLSRRFEATN